jgi:alanine racemase
VVPARVAFLVREAHAWLEIDRATLVANAVALGRKAAPASLCAVIKSNAYGHGLIPVAHALAGSGIDGLRFAVFAASEAFALRQAGIEQPILVVGPVADADLAEVGLERLQLALFDESQCEAFARHHIAAHVKIESGTNRFGIPAPRADAALRRCRDLGVAVVGLYSHLANAEDIDKDFTMRQVEALRTVGRLNATAGYYPGARLHIAASAAAMMWPEARLDMVRCGIALYGAWPSNQVQAVLAGDDPSFELRPALRWFAPIAQVHDVAAGESVGYGRAFVAERASRIAIVPLGYADGLPRAAGLGRLRARTEAGNAPVVGRVCMNACMLDVTDLPPSVGVGERVEFDVDDVARAAGTINYEILVGLPAHLERRYR